MKKREEVYDASSGAEELIEEAAEEIIEEAKSAISKFKDPEVIAMIIQKAANERESTNRLLRSILEKLDSIDQRVKKLEGEIFAPLPSKPPEPPLLPDVDEEILHFIGMRKYVCAEDIQKALNYKGKNAASARLNRLYERGLLEKKQVGRKVMYMLKQ